MEIRKLVNAFAARVEAEGLPVEAIAVYQGDKFAVSHRWTEDKPRNIYSHTKSFSSTAVGLAVAEGLLSLEDKPAEFFPEALPENPAPQWAKVTLRDCLTMSSGVGESLLMEEQRLQGVGSPDYLGFVFAHGFQYAPGTHFHYSNGDTYLAARMAEKVMGKDLCDLLMERLFQPMGIPMPRWERCPQRHAFAAGGMWLRTEDMMKLGRLYLKGGRWNGLQLVSPEWIRDATARHIDTPPYDNGTGLSCGYGYQFWMCPYPGAFRADGKYCQYTVVLPEAEVVVGMQCAEADRSSDIQVALHQELLSRIK